MSRRGKVICCSLCFVVLLAGFVVLGIPAADHAAPRPGETPGILRIEESGYVYTYHLLTGTEALFDVRSDPHSLRNVLPLRREEGLRLRHELERKLGVQHLEDLRQEYTDEIRALESLGYL